MMDGKERRLVAKPGYRAAGWGVEVLLAVDVDAERRERKALLRELARSLRVRPFDLRAERRSP
jgi:hypothetical protein